MHVSRKICNIESAGCENKQLLFINAKVKYLIGTPSWTSDISRAILTLIDQNANGVFHFTNEGVASWYDFANEIIMLARDFGFSVKTESILLIPSSEYPVPAKRPYYSVMSKEKIRKQLGYAIPHRRSSLVNMLEQLNDTSGTCDSVVS